MGEEEIEINKITQSIINAHNNGFQEGFEVGVESGKYEERHIIMDILDSADDSENAMYLLGQYLISQELKGV